MRIFALFKKEYIQFFRNIALLGMVVFAFSLDIQTAGNTSYDLKDYEVAVYDMDKSQMSAKLLAKILPPYFKLKKMVNSDKEVNDLLTRGDISLVMIIPHDFSKNLSDGKNAEIQFVVDGTRSSSAITAMNYLSVIVDNYSREITVSQNIAGGGNLPSVEANVRYWYNPSINSGWSGGVNELLIMITLMSVMLPAATIVQEKEIGTIEQLMVTPASNIEIMFAKIIPMMTILLSASVFSIYVMLEWSLGIPLQGSVLFFLIITALHIFSSSGIGLLISTITRNMAETMMLSLLVVTPLLFLSGTFSPCDTMPAGVRELTYLSPLRWYVTISYAIFFKGAGPGDLIFEITALVTIGVSMFLYSAARFKKSMEMMK
jgi:ABC-2 type transport system permease protein